MKLYSNTLSAYTAVKGLFLYIFEKCVFFEFSDPTGIFLRFFKNHSKDFSRFDALIFLFVFCVFDVPSLCAYKESYRRLAGSIKNPRDISSEEFIAMRNKVTDLIKWW